MLVKTFLAQKINNKKTGIFQKFLFFIFAYKTRIVNTSVFNKHKKAGENHLLFNFQIKSIELRQCRIALRYQSTQLVRLSQGI